MVVINLQIGFSSLGANGVFFSNSRLNSSNIHGVSISQKPICGMVLGSAGVRKSWAFCFRRPKFGIINALPEDDVETNSTSSRLLEKEFRFSPTFDEYIKVLESVKTNRSRILNEERDVHALKKNSVRRDARFTEKRDLSKSKKHLCKEKFYSEEKARYSEHARGNAPNQKSGVAEKSGSAWALVEGVLEKKAKEKRAERQSGCLESRSEDFDSGRNALYKKTKGSEKVVNQDGNFEKKRTSQRRPEEPRENWQKLRRLDELESSSVVKNELGRGYNGKPQFTPYRADEDLNGQRNGLHKKSNGSEEVIDDEILENRRMSQRRLKETEEYRKELRSLDELKSTNFARGELGCGDYRKSNHSKRLRYGGSNEGTMVSQTERHTFAKIVGKNGSSLRFDNKKAKDKPRISRIEAVGMEENQHNQAINAKERNVYTSAKEIYHKGSNRSNAKFHGDMREGYTFAKIVGKDGSSLRFDNMNAKGQPRRGKIEAVGMEGNLHNQAINAKERNMYTSAKEVYHKGNNRSNAKCHGDMIEAEKLNSTALISSGRPGRTVVSYPDVSKRERDDVTLENRAAFRTFEVFTDVRNRSRVLRMEMEERIRDLAKWLNASDLNMPEWQFSKMIHSAKIKFSEHSILRIVQILGSFGNWRRVLQVIEWFHSRERFKYYKSRYIYTTALDVLGKAKRPMEALNIFYAMRQELSSYPDLAAYHCIAVTLGQAGLMKELFDVIDLMRAAPVKKFDLGPLQKWDPRLEPDVVVYNAVLNACVQQKQWEGAFWVLQELKEQGIRPSSTTYGLIMEVMLACGKYNLVHEFFRKLQKNSIPGALNFKVLVNTLWREGMVEEAVQAVKDMERRGIVGCASLYYDLARCLCSAGRCEEALHQINKICKVAKKPLVVTYTGLIQACLDSGNIENAAYIFNQMTSFCSPNVITCNIMLKSYVEHEMFEEAKDLFQKILSGSSEINRKDESSQKVLPDKFTFNTMIEACTAESKWDDFEYSYREMLHHGYHFDERRHMRLVFDAWRAGKKNILEITWDHLTGNGHVPPPSIIKELFCMKMEEDEPASAVAFITIHQDMEIEAFSEKSWLNLLERKVQHISSKALARLVHQLRSIISESARPHPVYQNLLSACKQFASTLRGEDLILLCKPEESS